MAAKTPIKLRQRTLSDGSASLYLDIYVDGHRRYEYLKLYLVPEHSRDDKAANKKTMMLAESIRAKRLVELQNGVFGFDNGFQLDASFLDYFKALTDARRGHDHNWQTWHSTYLHLCGYCRPGTTFRDITARWIEGFIRYLDTATHIDRGERVITKALSNNTKQLYYSKLKSCLHQAALEHIIPENPCTRIKGYTKQETERVFLTVDELKAMAATECRHPVLKRAFLFSCLTGLRKSDIQNLKWGDVTKVGDFTRITFQQQKTKGLQYLDITPQAVELMGTPGKPKEKVFAGFNYSTTTNIVLNQWAIDAGISKRLTYHCSRHTFAVLMLTLGTDFYTVSRLLGHSDITTTMVYAHILDKTRQNAVAAIPDVLGTDNKDSKGHK